MAKDLLGHFNLFLVEGGGLHWTPSKQKLIADVHQKQNTDVHHVLLWWMLVNGFYVTKTHGAPQVNQKPYMKTVIDTFVSKRLEAKTKVKKEILKVILNLIFGKMCESVRNRRRCDVVTEPKGCVTPI